MKHTNTIKVIATIAMLSTMSNAYSFDQLTKLNERANALQALGGDKDVRDDVKKIEAAKEELLGGLSKSVSNIIKLTQSNKLLNEREKYPNIKDSRVIAYKLSEDHTEGRKNEEIKFTAKKVRESIEKYDKIDDGVSIANAMIFSTAHKIKEKDLDPKKVNAIENEFNSFFGLDSRGEFKKKNYGECMGLSAEDMSKYKESTDKIMAEYEEEIQTNSSLIQDKIVGKSLEKASFVFTNKKEQKVTIDFKPAETLKLEAKLIAETDHVATQEALDLNTSKEGQLTLNKDILEILSNFGLSSADLKEKESNFKASKEDTDQIKTLVKTIFENSIDQIDDRANETIAQPYLERMTNLEGRFKTNFGCYINEDSIDSGKYVKETILQDNRDEPAETNTVESTII